MNDSFFVEGNTRLLTPPAFQFILDGELKRAVRLQNVLTLVVIEAQREWHDTIVAADDGTVDRIARLIGDSVRDTDLLSRSEKSMLSLVLLDAAGDDSSRVIDRLMSRIGSYDFPIPLRISVGAACYPTDAVDVESLKQQAVARPVVNWRRSPPMPKAAGSGE
jgi:GGDEF domain-containing protein